MNTRYPTPVTVASSATSTSGSSVATSAVGSNYVGYPGYPGAIQPSQYCTSNYLLNNNPYSMYAASYTSSYLQNVNNNVSGTNFNNNNTTNVNYPKPVAPVSAVSSSSSASSTTTTTSSINQLAAAASAAAQQTVAAPALNNQQTKTSGPFVPSGSGPGSFVPSAPGSGSSVIDEEKFKKSLMNNNGRKDGWHLYLSEEDRKQLENIFKETIEFEIHYTNFEREFKKMSQTTNTLGDGSLLTISSMWNSWKENLLNRRQQMLQLQEKTLDKLYEKIKHNYHINDNNKPLISSVPGQVSSGNNAQQQQQISQSVQPPAPPQPNKTEPRPAFAARAPGPRPTWAPGPRGPPGPVPRFQGARPPPPSGPPPSPMISDEKLRIDVRAQQMRQEKFRLESLHLYSNVEFVKYFNELAFLRNEMEFINRKAVRFRNTVPLIKFKLRGDFIRKITKHNDNDEMKLDSTDLAMTPPPTQQQQNPIPVPKNQVAVPAPVPPPSKASEKVVAEKEPSVEPELNADKIEKQTKTEQPPTQPPAPESATKISFTLNNNHTTKKKIFDLQNETWIDKSEDEEEEEVDYKSKKESSSKRKDHKDKDYKDKKHKDKDHKHKDRKDKDRRSSRRRSRSSSRERSRRDRSRRSSSRDRDKRRSDRSSRRSRSSSRERDSSRRDRDSSSRRDRDSSKEKCPDSKSSSPPPASTTFNKIRSIRIQVSQRKAKPAITDDLIMSTTVVNPELLAPGPPVVPPIVAPAPPIMPLIPPPPILPPPPPQLLLAMATGALPPPPIPPNLLTIPPPIPTPTTTTINPKDLPRTNNITIPLIQDNNDNSSSKKKKSFKNNDKNLLTNQQDINMFIERERQSLFGGKTIDDNDGGGGDNSGGGNQEKPPPYTDQKFFTQPRKFTEDPLCMKDLLDFPSRSYRPSKIVFIIRGLPGSGKSYLAKLIKEKEEQKNSLVKSRTLSLDDYFMVEREPPLSVSDDNNNRHGQQQRPTIMVYEYDPVKENEYKFHLFKEFRKIMTNGYYNFVILDSINSSITDVRHYYVCAIENNYVPYVIEMEAILRRLLNDCIDGEEIVAHCYKHNKHGRSLAEIRALYLQWELLPVDYLRVDSYALMQGWKVHLAQMSKPMPPSSNNQDQDSDERLRMGLPPIPSLPPEASSAFKDRSLPPIPSKDHLHDRRPSSMLRRPSPPSWAAGGGPPPPPMDHLPPPPGPSQHWDGDRPPERYYSGSSGMMDSRRPAPPFMDGDDPSRRPLSPTTMEYIKRARFERIMSRPSPPSEPPSSYHRFGEPEPPEYYRRYPPVGPPDGPPPRHPPYDEDDPRYHPHPPPPPYHHHRY